MHGLKAGRDVGLGHLRGVGLQHVGLCGFYIRDRCCQSLPQAQQIVHAVGGKLPVLGHRVIISLQKADLHILFSLYHQWWKVGSTSVEVTNWVEV